MNGDDAGVSGHPARSARLTQEATLFSFGVQLAFVDLDGDQPVQRLLPEPADDSEAAAGDRTPIRHTGNLRWNGAATRTKIVPTSPPRRLIPHLPITSDP